MGARAAPDATRRERAIVIYGVRAPALPLPTEEDAQQWLATNAHLVQRYEEARRQARIGIVWQPEKHATAPKPRTRPSRKGPACKSMVQQGVYIVQLLLRCNTMKIGQSAHVQARLKEIRTKYGVLRVVLVIPHAHPGQLEKTLHERFAAMRLYNGAGTSELFCFDTASKRKRLEQFIQEYSTCVVESVQWEKEKTQREKTIVKTQQTLTLFPT